MTTTVIQGADTRRADYIKGLRKLADLLEADPRLPLPYGGNDDQFSMFVYQPDAINKARVVMDAMDEPPIVKVDDRGGKWLDIGGRLDGLRVVLHLPAEDVCERQEMAVVSWAIPAELLQAVTPASETGAAS